MFWKKKKEDLGKAWDKAIEKERKATPIFCSRCGDEIREGDENIVSHFINEIMCGKCGRYCIHLEEEKERKDNERYEKVARQMEERQKIKRAKWTTKRDKYLTKLEGEKEKKS